MTNITPLGIRLDPDEDIALSAILTDYKTTFDGPTVIYFTDRIGPRLEAEHGLPADRYAWALNGLIRSGALTGKQVIGAPTRWTIQVPANTWEQYARATGVDFDGAMERMLEKVRSAASPTDLRVAGFEGLDYWTVWALVSRLQTLGLIRFYTTTDGAIGVSWVKPTVSA